MNQLSPFRIIILAIFGALAVSGVLVFAFYVGGGQTKSTVGTVVVWGTLDQTTFQTALQPILQDNPDLLGVSYVQKDEATFDQTLVNALAEKRGPDLYIISSDDAARNEDRVITIPYTSLSQQQFKDLFAASANPFLGSTGVIALPFMIDPLVMYWNLDLLASSGFAEAPTRWDQVSQMAQVMSNKDPTGNVLSSGIALGTYHNIENAKSILSMLFMQWANVGSGVLNPITDHNSQGDLVSVLNSSFGQSAPPAVGALSFYTEFANPTQPDYSWNDSFPSARSAFAQGKVGLYLGFASENKLISAINPNLNYSIAPVPQEPGSVRAVTFGRAYGFAIPLTSSNPQGALLAAQFLNDASSSAALAQAFGMAPAKRSALNLPVAQGQAFINKMALVAWNWTDPDPTQTNDMFRGMIEDVVSGAVSPAEAISRTHQQLQHLLKQ